MVDHSELRAALSACQILYLDTDVISAGALVRIETTKGGAVVHLQLGFPLGAAGRAWAESVEQALGERFGPVRVELHTRIASHAVQSSLTPLPEIKNIVAVASGKGGVGKSTVAANLALAIAADGARVGLLDADIYGPSQPRMLGAGGQPASPDGKTMEPVMAHGIQTMSIGYLIDVHEPTIWRGPMVTQALTQMLTGTRWQGLDYLVIDLPPGTGDTQLSLVQRIPVSGAVIVTTPQDIALLDARKGLEMFRKVSVPVLGVIENMAVHVCEHCGHTSHPFGDGGGAKMAADTGTPLLGQLPLSLRVREQADAGTPIVRAEPESDAGRALTDIARSTTARLAGQVAGQGLRFPTITILDD